MYAIATMAVQVRGAAVCCARVRVAASKEFWPGGEERSNSNGAGGDDIQARTTNKSCPNGRQHGNAFRMSVAAACGGAHCPLPPNAQFGYMLLVGSFPFNAFLAGFFSCVGFFSLTGKLLTPTSSIVCMHVHAACGLAMMFMHACELNTNYKLQYTAMLGWNAGGTSCR